MFLRTMCLRPIHLFAMHAGAAAETSHPCPEPRPRIHDSGTCSREEAWMPMHEAYSQEELQYQSQSHSGSARHGVRGEASSVLSESDVANDEWGGESSGIIVEESSASLAGVRRASYLLMYD